MKITAPKILSVLEEAELTGFGDEANLEGVRLRGLNVTNKRATSVAIDEAVIEKLIAVEAKLERLHLSDVKITNSDFSGANCTDSSLIRVQLSSSRCAGWDVSQTVIKDVTFKDCKLDMANFLYAKLTNVQFIDCSLVETDFQAATLTHVAFQNCLFDKTECAQITVKDVDLRSSQLLEIKGWTYLRGVILDHAQLISIAPQLAQALGLKMDND